MKDNKKCFDVILLFVLSTISIQSNSEKKLTACINRPSLKMIAFIKSYLFIKVFMVYVFNLFQVSSLSWYILFVCLCKTMSTAQRKLNQPLP